MKTFSKGKIKLYLIPSNTTGEHLLLKECNGKLIESRAYVSERAALPAYQNQVLKVAQ